MWVAWSDHDDLDKLEPMTWDEAFAYMRWLSTRNIPAYARKVPA
ncbi:hypothetical protein HOT75_gp005 [Gordonia phage Daredevil]|uniref:Uncharacterized protein n=1 Tax=Gordonia phage Daredevil TaxID=2283286 RepID=A0A345MIL2_9CAUD|nr:hypothetical protein HOT75_gp005 [Gordonia phage Daredevil]AXH70393.1 hypothetical protein SEA_DAREDEVIL_5 [Gordonia phage Daredevil]